MNLLHSDMKSPPNDATYLHLLWILNYSGGQKCWGLPCDINKTGVLPPSTTNNVEF